MNPAPPEILGSLINNNLAGSTTNSLSKQLSETVSQTETWGEATEDTLKGSVEFSVGVPKVASGTVKAELTGSIKHTIGNTEFASK